MPIARALAEKVNGRWDLGGAPDHYPSMGRAREKTKKAPRLDHVAPWASYYTHLSALSVRPGQVVDAGEPIGIVGGDPSKPPHLRHLHFALWRGKWQDAAVNPAPL